MDKELTIEEITRATENGNTFFAKLATQLLSTMQREEELRNALDDISRMDTKYQTLEMAMDIAKAVLSSEYPLESGK